jgi:hypothetical protein
LKTKQHECLRNIVLKIDEKVERNYWVTGVYAVKVVSIITVIDFREKRPQLLISKFAL